MRIATIPIVYGFISLSSTLLCNCIRMYLLGWLDKPTHSASRAASQCSQALPYIVSDFLFGKSPCDSHALEDLGPCEISPGELATPKSMLCLPCLGRSLDCFVPTPSLSWRQWDGSAQVHLVVCSEPAFSFPTVCSQLTNDNKGDH